MDRVYSEVDAKIFEMWAQGDSRDETARATGTSQGHVSAKWATIPASFRPLRDLAVALRKLNFLPNDALRGTDLLQLLTQYGITHEKIILFLETVRKASVEAGYQPEKVIQAHMELTDLENKSGKPYTEALKEYQTLAQQLLEERKEKSQLELETKENKRLCDEALEQAKTTPGQISEFQYCKASYGEYGMDIDDAETVRRVLDNIKEADGNPKRLISLVKRHGSLTRSLANVERQLPIRQAEHESLVSQNRKDLQTVTQRQKEKEQLQIIIDRQRNDINFNNHQLSLIRADIEEKERYRQALIDWISKQKNLSQEETENLRVESQYEILRAATFNALTQYQRTLMAGYNAYIKALISQYRT